MVRRNSGRKGWKTLIRPARRVRDDAVHNHRALAPHRARMPSSEAADALEWPRSTSSGPPRAGIVCFGHARVTCLRAIRSHTGHTPGSGTHPLTTTTRPCPSHRSISATSKSAMATSSSSMACPST
ncbi:hypothetical protein DF153_21605 [Burkholderia cenocepacia]|nr:hypothetical protein DF152_12415 [Burkholderia cenocepacia]RQU21096.1 hypothetical protein DF153_21605 [Burkholderia cenocepacia]